MPWNRTCFLPSRLVHVQLSVFPARLWLCVRGPQKKKKEKRTEEKGTERPKLNRICRKLAINFNFESDSPALIEVNQSVAAI